ncbi:MAG: tetratricopeptide repeat protein [Thermodesulfobacteriota bacterium]
MPVIPEGVYIETVVQSIGTGSTARKQEIRNCYLAKSLDEELVQVQLMDMDDKLLPIFEKVPWADFQRRFKHEPDYFARKKSPLEKKVDQAIAQAEAHVRRQEYNSAEFEYNKALKLDEENVRANFGLGKVYLSTGEMDKAKATFAKLAKIEAVFEVKNKHVFNELGIELRRLGLYDQAIDYYLKALSFAQDDEHLHFNVARAYFEKGDLKNSMLFLGKALTMKPDLTEARKLLQAIEKAGGY